MDERRNEGGNFKDVLSTFSNIPDYTVKHKLVYAKYYGVPQRRPRVLIVGNHKDLDGQFEEREDAVMAGYLPFPTSDYPSIEDIFSDLVDKKFEYGGSTSKYPSDPKNNWQENIRTLPTGNEILTKGQDLADKNMVTSSKVVERFSHMIANREIPENLTTKSLLAYCKILGNKGQHNNIT